MTIDIVTKNHFSKIRNKTVCHVLCHLIQIIEENYQT